MKDTKYVVYTDGSCIGNPGPGGWAAIIINDGNQKIIKGRSSSTTNNRMELTAIVKALSSIPEGSNVTIYSDSQYITDMFNKGWIYNWAERNWKKVKNKDLVVRLYMLTRTRNVTFVKVEAHSSNVLNNKADKIAYQEAVKASKETAS